MKIDAVNIKFLFLGICLIICSGCATLLARSEHSGGFVDLHVAGLYPASRLDVLFIPGKDPEIGLLFLLDLPISLAFDTLLIPYDVFRE